MLDLQSTKTELLGTRQAYHLAFLGTRPGSQRKGYATRLIAEMVEMADEKQRPMYIEASSEANAAYYQRFGFVVMKKIDFGGFPVTIMIREPGSSRGQA